MWSQLETGVSPIPLGYESYHTVDPFLRQEVFRTAVHRYGTPSSWFAHDHPKFRTEGPASWETPQS